MFPKLIPKFRKCEEVSEFLHKVNQIKDAQEDLLVWTSMENARSLARARISLVFKRKGKIGLRIHLDKELEENSQSSLYFYHEESASLFKAKIEARKSKAIEATVYGNPFLAEMRENQRFEFSNAQYFLEVRTYRQNIDRFSNHKVALKNISKCGVAFTIGAGRALRFQKGDRIVLTKVEKTVLPSSIPGKIAHVTPLKVALGSNDFTGFSKAVLVGVEFDKPSDLIAQTLDLLMDR